MATRDIPEGEELTTRYKAGTLHRPDASLFLYGFLPEASPRWKECGRVHAASWLMADTRAKELAGTLAIATKLSEGPCHEWCWHCLGGCRRARRRCCVLWTCRRTTLGTPGGRHRGRTGRVSKRMGRWVRLQL